MQQKGQKQFWITTPQLAALGIITLSLAALAFFLGLMVGRGQGAPGAAALAQNGPAVRGLISTEIEDDSITELLARVEQAAAAHAKKAEPVLEFPDALIEEEVKLRLPQAEPPQEAPVAVVEADEGTKPEMPELVENPTDEAGPPPTEGWAVQVASYPRSELAEGRIQTLRAGGHSAYVVHALVKGQTWYRVRIGPYVSAEEAKKARVHLSQVLAQSDLLVTAVQ
jgi:cell division protein FtsN